MQELKRAFHFFLLGMIGLILVTFGVMAWAMQGRAATLFSTLGHASSTNVYWANEAAPGAPTFGKKSWVEFDFVTSTDVVICSLETELWTNATSGNSGISADVNGTPYEAVISYPNSGYTSPGAGFTWTLLQFNFEPCIVLYANNVVSFTGEDVDSFSGAASPGAPHRVSMNASVVTSTEISRWEGCDNTPACSSYFALYPSNNPRISINGEDSVSGFTYPVPADFGLSGTSTNPGDFGLFGNWFISAMQWLFVPSTEAMTSLASSTQSYRYTVPFGYVTLALDAIGDSFQPGLATSTLGIPIPGHATLTVFDPSAFASQTKAMVWVGNIRTWTSWGLWFLFVWWLYHRAMQQTETL